MIGPISRRRLLSWMVLASSVAASRAGAEEEKPSDRGIGGTGISSEPDGNRLSSIGFMGTIQRFGSIYVNDARITYPKDVAVWVDGRRRDASALSIGSVVRSIAHEEKGKLVTDRIDMISEVIGPIASYSDSELVVLGQRVLLTGTERPSWWQPGARAAVCGLRTAEGAIVGTEISPAGDRPNQIVGVPTLQGWNLRIGDMPLLGIAERYAGWRVIVRGTPTENGLRVRDVDVDAPFEGKDVDRLSIETYVARSGSGFRSGAGIEFRDAQLNRFVGPDREARAVMDVVVNSGGNVSIQRLRLEGGGGGSPGIPGPSPGDRDWPSFSGPAGRFSGGTIVSNGMDGSPATIPGDSIGNVDGGLRGSVGLGGGPSATVGSSTFSPPSAPSLGGSWGPRNNVRGNFGGDGFGQGGAIGGPGRGRND
ncbi:hypothetical protein C3941_08035 [Kaistia algarum]|uniref:hypothetical protein n=1 Tax=Kaistia algarum TaxID=2083279 RepID=UPI000CE7E670|nr:hypothetical protein [Kaistia algarum]MCX5512006.1 hypothetical protein [Kaistia algarum]PPE80134.1 hypothetical protein C3941_08035 [Kaistia algarum]